MGQHSLILTAFCYMCGSHNSMELPEGTHPAKINMAWSWKCGVCRTLQVIPRPGVAWCQPENETTLQGKLRR